MNQSCQNRNRHLKKIKEFLFIRTTHLVLQILQGSLSLNFISTCKKLKKKSVVDICAPSHEGFVNTCYSIMFKISYLHTSILMTEHH